MLLIACSPDTPEVPASRLPKDAGMEDPNWVPAGIQWRQGDVEAAFAEAKASNKPLFLYWGAEWCPPCHQLKVTVFNKLAFIERSRLFVPIYLDGDTERGQKYAARFGVMGYPTIVVFNPDGQEITRIPGGLDMEAYMTVLDLTLSDVRPVVDLVDTAVTGESLASADCQLLAYYSWGEDNEGILDQYQARALFPILRAACPAELTAERSRLFMEYLAAVAEEQNSDQPDSLKGKEYVAALAGFNEILADYTLVKANLESFLGNVADAVKTLTAPGTAEREELIVRLEPILTRIRQDEALPKRERIYTARARVWLEQLDKVDAAISAELKSEIQATVAWADQTTSDRYERQTVMNAAANTLVSARMYDEARALLTAEIEISGQPYYFMLSRAELEQEANQPAAALEWYERAYHESKGPATRFQWGYNYLTGLLELSPEDEKRIETETIRVFQELENIASNAFYQRTRVRLEQLEQSFAEWNRDGRHGASIRVIRAGVMEVCRRIPVEDESRQTCEAFLDSV